MKQNRVRKVLRAFVLVFCAFALAVPTTGCLDLESLASFFGEGIGSGVGSQLAPQVGEALDNIMKLAEGVIQGGIDVEGNVTFPGAETVTEENPDGEPATVEELPTEDTNS